MCSEYISAVVCFCLNALQSAETVTMIICAFLELSHGFETDAFNRRRLHLISNAAVFYAMMISNQNHLISS